MGDLGPTQVIQALPHFEDLNNLNNIYKVPLCPTHPPLLPQENIVTNSGDEDANIFEEPSFTLSMNLHIHPITLYSHHYPSIHYSSLHLSVQNLLNNLFTKATLLTRPLLNLLLLILDPTVRSSGLLNVLSDCG